MAGLRVARGDQRRGEVEGEPVAALELLAEAASELGIAVEPRHLVLVLHGEQLEIIAPDRPGEAGEARRARRLGRPGPQLGRAAGREGGGSYVESPVVAVKVQNNTLQTEQQNKKT